MRKIIFTAAMVSSLMIGIHLTYAETIEVTAIDWCPQICPGKEKPGYIMDIVNSIFKEGPYQLNIRTYPWTRAISMVRKGEAHALLSPAKGEAPDLLYPENELGIQRYCFITKADSRWHYSGAESLRDLQIGVYYDVYYGEIHDYVLQNTIQFQYMPYNKDAFGKNLKKLAKGRINTFLHSYNTSVYELHALGVEKKYRSAGCVSLDKLYMAFSPKKSQKYRVQRMMKYFDRKMDELKQSGRIKEIMGRYGLKNWADPD